MFGKVTYSDSRIVELISSSGKSEGKAIQYLLDSNRLKIKSLVLKQGGSEQDAENILIEGVTSLVMNIRNQKFKGESSISTYLYAICKRTWLKSMQKEKRYSDWNEESDLGTSGESPFSFFNNEQLKAEVNFLLGKLGKACQTVLKLWAGHYSMTEIALRMEYKNAQIAMNKKNKCMKQLKELVLENASYREELSNYLYSE